MAKAAGKDKGEGLKKKKYEKALKKLHIELVKLQEWVKYKGLKVCIVFEGRDGAGKGGTIKALTDRVSPRVFRVLALPTPSERERSQMYIQRYLPHLPAAGEVVIWDRSWYNRAGVERVMGFCAPDKVAEFLTMVPAFEKIMIRSGIILLKYWLEVSMDEQTRRLEQRIEDGRKIWKLSPMDVLSYSKRRARLNIISHILDKVPYKKAPREKVKLPKRGKPHGYREPNYPYKYVPARY